MKNQKMYEPDDKMISLIRDNYNLLQSLGSFGISLGFGDKTVSQVCEEQHVDTYTFLAVVNFTINGYRDIDDATRLSMPTLLQGACRGTGREGQPGTAYTKTLRRIRTLYNRAHEV